MPAAVWAGCGSPGRPATDRSARTGPAATGTLIVAAVAASQPKPVRVVVVPWIRNERSAIVGLKTTSYAENVVALAHAQERGGAEAIFANGRDELCEGTGTNVFVERDDAIVTPPLDSGCLAGVTRGAGPGVGVRRRHRGPRGDPAAERDP